MSATSGCADVVDLGETSYSMVLADDLNGDGRTDLVVTTMNGNVYAFQTPARHHPLASWTAQVRLFGNLLTPTSTLGTGRRCIFYI